MEMTPHRIALVETSEALPGLLPFQAWDVLGMATQVFVRDATTHPSAPYLHAAGLDLVTLDPVALERADMDLVRPGNADDRRLAKALLARVSGDETPTYLLGPEDGGLAAALAGMAGVPDVEIELVFLAPTPAGTEMLRLVGIMRELRDPDGGCPWDLEQDHASLVRYLLEETYELVDAIESGDDEQIVEELGDVLLQVVFHAQVAADRRAFGIDEVARGIHRKLVRRHPHVFSDGTAETAEDVQSSWDALKAEEKGRTGPFDGVPPAMAGLAFVETVQRKAARSGFDPAEHLPPGADVSQQLGALRSTADPDRRVEILGGLISAIVGLAREFDVDPEAAARSAARSLRDQVEAMIGLAAERGLALADLDDAAWLRLRDEVTDKV